MAGPTPIVSPEVVRYLDAFRPAREGILGRLEREAKAEEWPIVGPATAALLDLLVRLLRPERVLEIGTAIGYSGIVIARALAPWGNLETIEVDLETADRATANFKEAGLAKVVTVHRGSALQIMGVLQNRYDLVFIDGAKEEYESYLALVLPLVASGGTIVVDNCLWGGRVALESPPEGPDDYHSKATPHVRAFNETFLRHPGLRAEILPVGDGIGLAVKL